MREGESKGASWVMKYLSGPIYLVGSHSTGKTTMARALSKTLGLPLVSEVAREVLANREQTLADIAANVEEANSFQRDIFRLQLAREDAAGRVFVSDRALDFVAYSAMTTTVTAEIVRTPEFVSYIKKARRGVVLFVRPHPDLIRPDGVRHWLDQASVYRIDGMIQLALELADIEYTPIETINMRDRMRIALNAITNNAYRALTDALLASSKKRT